MFNIFRTKIKGDIISSKDLLKKIEKIKQEWETTADNLSELICLVNRDAEVLRTNKTVEDWNLEDVEDVKGENIHDLLHPKCDSDSCYLKSFFEKSLEKISHGHSLEREKFDRELDRYIQIITQPVSNPEEKSKNLMITIVRDITERKYMEEEEMEAAVADEKIKARTMEAAKRYSEDIIQNIPISLIVLDENLDSVFVNNKFYENFVGGSKEVEGKNILDIFPSQMIEDLNFKDFLNNVLETGRFEEIKKYNFKEKIYNIKISKIRRASEKELLVVIDDISEGKIQSSFKDEKLTENERIVLYGILSDPNGTDSDIHGKYNIKRSTVTSIRNKLKDENFYEIYNIPNFKLLDGDIVFATAGFSVSKPWRKRRDSKIYKKIVELPELIYSMHFDNYFFGLFVGKGFNDLKNIENDLSIGYREEGFLDERVNFTYFPLNSTDSVRFFDYKPLFSKIFENDDSISDKNNDGKMEILTKNQKRIFYNLIEYPNISNKEIANKSGVSKSTITYTRKRLFQNRRLKTILYPNFTKLGFKLVLFRSFKTLRDINTRNLKNDETTMLISNGADLSSIGWFKNYSQFKSIKEMHNYDDRNSFGGEFNMNVNRLSDLRFKKIDFSGILKKILDI